MKVFFVSSLEKVFSEKEQEYKHLRKLSMLKNERSSFQLVIYSENDGNIELKVSGGLENYTKIYNVREVPVGLAAFDNTDDFYISKDSGMYPDLLEPSDGKINIKGGKRQSVWFELEPDGKISGKYNFTSELSENGKIIENISLDIEIIDALLPKQTLIYTNWYHSDCICNYYGIKAFDDEFWRINKNFIETAVRHGQNCILTPLFTPPLDTAIGGERTTVQLVKVKKSGGKYRFDFRNLKKWIDMCKECGIEYFEMSHLFTQWGAKHAPKIIAKDRKGREKKIFGWFTRTSSREYDEFLRQLADALNPFLKKQGIAEKCFFHVSDEPSDIHLKTYKRRAELIGRLFPGYKVIDALSDYEFFETGAVKCPIPCENSVDDFVSRVPELWTYYCCGQGREYVPNRFIAMPSVRNRVLGMILYTYDIKGFLQWGYNFYNTQHSKKQIDPYNVTDAGNAFPAGDAFVVYPGKDGNALASLRLKVFYDGFQDMRALQLLEKLIGRKKALEATGTELKFKEYPQSAERLTETREKINQLIKENL